MKQLENNTGMFGVIAGLMLCTATGLCAQTTPPMTASVPSQFATARTAFLSNAGAPTFGVREKEASTMAYESVYKALGADGHYKLTGAPAEAELSFEISIGEVDSVLGGSSISSGYLRLAAYDVKTHCLLWNIDEPVKGAFRAASFLKNIDEATTKLTVDLHSLIAGKQP